MRIIDGNTEVYGIMGWPVAHSLSPLIQNRAFRELGLNKVYVPFPVDDVETALNGCRALSIRGISVTIPHKQAVVPFLDSIDPVAALIGAVNTLIIQDGRIHGCNTDWQGANRALAEAIELAGAKVTLLGAGGAARALGFGLLEAGAEVVIASRTPGRGRALAADLNCAWRPLTEVAGVRADVLINATSVGMAPDVDKTAVPAEILAGYRVVMDIVYAPLETRLLREAAEAGCRTINGLAMLLYQGAAQFELWTGRQPPLAAMRQELDDIFK
ncbi:MAG: shikimate dehydrogenase [Desulfobulbales bacterium]|nr:shikimate dehydrogenase [Desulfobulbales bacterium]